MTKSLFGGRFASAGVTSVLAVLATAATAVNFDGSSYARNASLDANMDIFWTIDTDLDTIRVAVHAKAATGWAGFGVSEMGGMEGADIVFYDVSTGNVTDAHTIVPGTPVTDECTQDWTLLSAEVDTDSLVFVAERDLDTGDTQDRVFVDDSADGAVATRILTAWGDDETISYHGANFAKGQVFLYGGVENSIVDPVVDIASDPGASSFDVRAPNFTIPSVRTTYEDTCVPASALPDLDEYHVIGFEAVVNNNTSKYVHHLVLRAYTVDNCGEGCDFDDPELSTSPLCENYNYADIFVWAPGSSDITLPDDVGFRLGKASGRFLSLRVETHYNNPDGDEGVIDDSGVRVYYTDELRPVDMGVIQLGDPFVGLDGVPVLEGRSSYSFECPSSCFEQYFEDDTVTVFSHGLHMHENGQRLETRQYRSNDDGQEVLVHAAEVEYYSFLQAGTYMITTNGSVTIQKGDRFETHCYYDTDLSSVGSDNVTFGEGSENEMCIDFILYYPDQDVPDSGACGLFMCNGSLNDIEELAADSDFERTFGIVDTCSTAAGDDEGESEADATSSSSTALPGLALLTYTVISAVALACAPVIVSFRT